MCCLQTDRISATHTPEEAADFSRNFSICCSVNSGVSSLPEDLFLIICLQDRGTYRARGKRWFYIYNTFFFTPTLSPESFSSPCLAVMRRIRVTAGSASCLGIRCGAWTRSSEKLFPSMAVETSPLSPCNHDRSSR